MAGDGSEQPVEAPAVDDHRRKGSDPVRWLQEGRSFRDAQKRKSVPQMPAASTAIRTWPEPTCGSFSSTSSIWPGPFFCFFSAIMPLDLYSTNLDFSILIGRVLAIIARTWSGFFPQFKIQCNKEKWYNSIACEVIHFNVTLTGVNVGVTVDD